MKTVYSRLLIVVTILILFNINQLKAQFTLSGKITDSSTNTGLELVTVKLQSENNPIRIISSDSTGDYSFQQLVPGTYTLTCSFLNFKERTISFLLMKDSIIDISLTRIYQQLNVVDVNARKPIIERKIDRLVFNVSNSIFAAGSDALELLSMAPQVKVDGNNISIIGKDEVSIMVNDRPLQMSSAALAAYLKSRPAESVESIEIMTNPSSIYSAQGSSGIINIIIKKEKELGYTGAVTANLRKSRTEGGRLAFNINYNRSKFRYFGDVSVSKGSQISTYTNSIYYSALTQKDSYETKELSQYVSTRGGFDADLSRSSTLGVSVDVFFSFPYQTSVTRSLFLNNINHDVDSVSKQYVDNRITYKSASANIHYEKKLDTIYNRRIVVDGDWTTSISDRPNTIDNNIYDAKGNPIPDRYTQTISGNYESDDFYSFNGVLYLPGKKHDLSVGSRINFINNSNNILLNISQPLFNSKNAFDFSESTQALFISYRGKIGNRWTMQSGLRGEFTQTKGHSYGTIDSINTNHYFNLFPTLYLQYKLNGKNVITADYGRRINRPAFNILNPYVRYYTQYQSMEGNPFLMPSISNNFSLSETYNNNLTISVQYSFSTDKFGAVNLTQQDSRNTLSKFYNYLSSRSFQSTISYTIANIKWLQSINEFNVYHDHTISDLPIVPVTAGWGCSFRSNNTAFFNSKRTISGGLNFSYQSRGVGSIYKMGSYYFLNVSARYLLLNNKLQMVLDVYDIFKTKNPSLSYTVNGILTTNKVNNDSRRIGISIRYNFGNNKLKTGKAHSAETNTGRAGG